MSDETVTRPGSSIDLSRRMERIENRQDEQARQIGSLTSAVERVEHSLLTADKVNQLQFESLKSAATTIAADLKGFMARIDSLLTGETVLPQQRDLMHDWKVWRDETDAEIASLKDSRTKQSGVFAAFGGIKQVVVLSAAIASPIITVILFALKP